MSKTFQKNLWRLLPRGSAANTLFALPYFFRRHHRFPRNPADLRATLEDYVFHRMVRPWTPFHESCVDKRSAKAIATTLAPHLKTAPTVAVLKMDDRTTLEHLGKFLYPYLGKPFVAKPTHTSGGVVFLDRPLPAVLSQTQALFRLARENYFFTCFEEQYRHLPRRILIEAALGPEAPPDFRFYAARGKVLFCQYDEGRFTDHRQVLLTVPGHEPIPIRDQYPLPHPLPGKSAHWDEMLVIAGQLSEPFEFVRVDLYDLPDGVYFSEFTFTPNASAFPFSDTAFTRKLLEQVQTHPGATS